MFETKYGNNACSSFSFICSLAIYMGILAADSTLSSNSSGQTTAECRDKELASYQILEAEMAAALWDVLEKAANLAQLCGLHAAMLVAVAMSLLWNPESKQECSKLLECARELRELLKWPTGCAIVMQDTDMGGLISKALRDADGLVDSYNMSTLWRRIRSGQSMAAQFRDMHNRINNYCRFVLIINGHLLMQAMNYPSDPDTRIHQLNDPPQTVQAVAECPTGAEPPQRANGIGQEGVGAQPGNTDDPGCDIVISNA